MACASSVSCFGTSGIIILVVSDCFRPLYPLSLAIRFGLLPIILSVQSCILSIVCPSYSLRMDSSPITPNWSLDCTCTKSPTCFSISKQPIWDYSSSVLKGVLLGALGDEKSRKGSVTGPICMELGTEKGVLRGGCGREREALGRVRKGEENWERESDRGWYLCIVNERGTGTAEGWRAKP